MQTSTKIIHQSDFLTSQYVNPSGICINSESMLLAGTFAHLSQSGSWPELADPAFIPALSVLASWVQLDLEEQFHSSVFQALSHLYHLCYFPVSPRQKLVQKRRQGCFLEGQHCEPDRWWLQDALCMRHFGNGNSC